MAFVLIDGIGVFLYFYITGRKHQKIYSHYLEEKRLFRVHLPEGYGESQERYPVFYLHHIWRVRLPVGNHGCTIFYQPTPGGEPAGLSLESKDYKRRRSYPCFQSLPWP